MSLEQAKAFLVEASSQKILPMGSYVGLEELSVYLRDVTKGVWTRGRFLPSVRQLLETHTFVFCGDPQMGKTPLAQSVKLAELALDNHFRVQCTRTRVRIPEIVCHSFPSY